MVLRCAACGKHLAPSQSLLVVSQDDAGQRFLVHRPSSVPYCFRMVGPRYRWAISLLQPGGLS